MLQAGLEMEKLSNLHTGLGMFCRNLGASLLELNPKDIHFQFYLPPNRLELFGKNCQILPQKTWHRWSFPRKYRTDVWHCLHQDSPYFPADGIPLLLTVHDLNFMQKYSGWRLESRKRRLGKMLEKSAAIVCISKATGRHLEEVFGLSTEDYRVVYNGNSLRHFPAERTVSQPDMKPFLLCLGVLSPRKNAHVLCGMMAHLPGMNLIIAGPQHGDYQKKILAEAHRMGVADRVILPGEVSEEEKYRLLMQMEGLVFPSLAEGFGLPVVEAMSLGKPVFLSGFGSMPEIGGAEAFYWENFDGMHMAEVVLSGLRKAALPEASAGLKKQAALFSWQKAALDYCEIYRSLLKRSF
jgi:glycosyltransferase involved in cell wall biosynthesis